jgi:20S proteasome subunit beta 6
MLCTGRGAVYTYDAIGSYERTGYSCQGSGKDLMQPVLDNQLKAASPLLVPARVRVLFEAKKPLV